jgi:hypothetical protein
MTYLRHHRIRSGILAGLAAVLAIPVTGAVAPTSARAA